MSHSLRIDSGTTFVLAAVARDRRAEMVPLGDTSALAHGSVHVGENGSLTNGDAAARRAVSDLDRGTHDPERRPGVPAPVMLGGVPFTVTALLGALLRTVLARAVEISAGELDTVVLTRPATWEPAQCRALADDAVPAHVDAAAGGFLHQLDMSDARTVVALARLRQDCTAAEEAVSVDMETTVPVCLLSRHMEVRLSRQGVQDLIRLPVESTLRALSRTLRTAGLAPGELPSVPLVGGSSRISGGPASVGWV